MNYFEIINQILIELNYTQVTTFSELTKQEHKRIMNIINRLNKEICNMKDNFQFRQTVKNISLSCDKKEYFINILGKIDKITGINNIYEFEPDYTKFYSNSVPEYSYGVYGEKFLFSPSNDKVKIFYSTNLFVKDINETLKNNFENETDKSIIPENFAERLFVNGVSYNFKQDTSHPKYVHWKNEYESALNELITSSEKITNSNIKINGGFRKL